jgi:hypothetical protein
MTGARWLARQYQDLMQDREGLANDSAASARGGDPATPSAPPPSRYPLVWRLSWDSLDALCQVAGWSRSELSSHAARRPLVR